MRAQGLIGGSGHLGTHRPGVTLALQTLEKEGVIAASRARITILDRKGLQKRSNGTYVPTDA